MVEATRYAIIGAGTRAWKAYLPLFSYVHGVAPFGTLVGVGDDDPARLAAVSARWDVPTFASADVGPMLGATCPDLLIVTTPDHAHAGQVTAALAEDVSVLVEKPLAVTLADAVEVVSAEQRSRGSIQVAHNMRYLNLHQEIRRVLVEGHLGTPVRVSLSYRLAPGHGRSYFRRWHKLMERSGGLQVTKSCHHFDLIGWWLADRPHEVVGWTSRSHYRGAPELGDDDLLVDDDADIDDEIDAVIRFRRGAVAHYSLSARGAWEGYTVTIEGTRGELTARYEVAAPRGEALANTYTVEIRLVDEPPRRITVPREPGTHSGADARMLRALLAGGADPTPATAIDGAYAVAVGEAVTVSARRGTAVAVGVGLPL
jgi:predicted dehydrogenase